jgi:phenylalanyl-tRNA synthetase beta chain
MNIPLSWLRDIVPIPDNATVFSQKATDVGVKVEGIVSTGGEITHVVVGRITSLERHPSADKLWVTTADVGPAGDTNPLQIVTGADNLRVGDYIPVALHGATLHGGLRIKRSKMRGMESNGMLCSIGELGLTHEDCPEATEDGIYVFPSPHPIGADAKPILGLVEDVLEFEILSNRPDMNSVMGIAREAAAIYNVPFALPEISVREEGPGAASELVSVEIEDAALCPRYIARVVRDVRIAPSPRWITRRLEAAGLRPVNNIVDITNYVMLEYGQPLHAFDITAVAKNGGKHGVVIRTATPGERITTLDGVERTLGPTTLLIADRDKPIAIAGIMGGENTKIHDATTTILFESASFNPSNIRQSARALGMRTDASARYEKGPDPNLAATCVNRAMELVGLLGCGKVVSGMVDKYPMPRHPQTITFNPNNINKRLGTELTADEIRAYLKRVEIDTKKSGDVYEATIPTRLGPHWAEVDLSEEVARFYGYNNIKSRYVQQVTPRRPGSVAGESAQRTARRLGIAVKQATVGLGYYEAVTYPFESPKVADKLLLPADDPLRVFLPIMNPMVEDYSVMRTLTLGGLLSSLSLNYNKRNESARLFELAWAYRPLALPLTELPEEKPWLTLAAYGPDMDYLAIKGDVEDLLDAFVGGKLVFTPLGLPFVHPGRGAAVAYKPHPKRDAVPLGYLGELHPKAAANYDIETRVYVAAIDMDALYLATENRRTSFTPPSKYPALSRDLAFTIPLHISASEAESAIRERGGQWLTEVKLFDVYQGPQIEAGLKSMAYSLRFVSHDRTLTDEMAQKNMATICAHLSQKINAKVR